MSAAATDSRPVLEFASLTHPQNPWLTLRSRPADEAVWQELLRIYTAHGQAWQFDHVARQLARLRGQGAGKAPDLQDNRPPWARVEVEAVLSRSVMPDAPGRAQALQGWLDTHPGDWLAWVFLARVLDFCAEPVSGSTDKALQQAQTLEYLPGESAHLLGAWRLKSGHPGSAVAVLSQLVDLRPVRYGSMVHLGEALLHLGNARAAEVAFSRASHSNNPQLLAWLAEVVYRNNYWREAIEVLHKALSLQPDSADLWSMLANIQAQTYQLSECRHSLGQIRRLGAWDSQAALLEMRLLSHAGDAKRYWQVLRAQLVGAEQLNFRLVSSVLMTALYQDDVSAAEIAQLHRDLTAPLERAHSPAKRPPRTERRVGDRLRVGYVTGDLHRQHPINLFMLPLLEKQKSSSLHVHIYHSGTMIDAYTARAKACAHVWREVSGWDDATLHGQIVRDGIDVLVDLAGHTATHRLNVFIQRAAPVQASFLGYPHSTGLSTMDFLIGDKVVSPEGHEHLFSERIARLSGPVFCWAPVDDYPLPQRHRRSEPVVFGSFNNALKLSEKTIELWAKVMHAVPDAVLLLKAPSLLSQEVCDHFRSRFAQHSIDADRLVFRGPSELGAMMQEYGDIDIALDPLPYNGGTTSLQALWMGVPLVTMLGKNFASRMGASFLTEMGKSEWVAQDEAQYVEIAQGMAAQIGEIRAGRDGLRKRMLASDVCNMDRYALDFERVLREMFEAAGH